MLKAEEIRSRRLSLNVLQVHDAAEIFPILDDPTLHEFIGGQPLSLAELTSRFQRLETQQSPDGEEAWLNWIIRLADAKTCIGTVQASVSNQVAVVAWVVGRDWQNRGFASEAATALVAWLKTQGTIKIRAYIHPDHVASAKVATKAGLIATDEMIRGEVLWEWISAA